MLLRMNTLSCDINSVPFIIPFFEMIYHDSQKECLKP